MSIFLLLACVSEPPEYVYGFNVAEIDFQVHDLDMGVYPNNSLGQDPNNPFASTGVGTEERWQIFDVGAVPGFYAFGTYLLQEPTAENQFYTAKAAHDIYLTEQAPAEELWAVRQIALSGYYAVLEYFPDGVTYDATGTVSWPVAPLAEEGIVALGGEL